MKRLFRICSICLVSALIGLSLTNAASTQAPNHPKTIRIIYTNDTIGYLEPCGCGGRYQGGLARRANVIAHLTKENPDVLLVDSGNLSDKIAKLPLVTKIMAGMHYDAVGIGEVDSSFADDYFKSTTASGLKVVDTANAKDIMPVPYLIKKIGTVKVGVVSFGKAANSAVGVQPNSRQSFCVAYRQARKHSNVLILLDQGGIATKEWLGGEAIQLGVPDIVIAGVMNSIMPREQVVGKTHIVPTSVQGKLLGVIDVSFSAGRLKDFTVQMVPVDRSVPEDEAVKKQISDFLHKQTQASSFAMTQGSGVRPTRKKGDYYNAEFCKTCHPDQYEDWRMTNHARAVQTLKSKNRLIGECLECHSEEFRQTRNIPITSDIPAGVECSTCHASVVPHGIEGPASSAIRKVNAKTCLECHTSERSPGYKENAYFDRISHAAHRRLSAR